MRKTFILCVCIAIISCTNESSKKQKAHNHYDPESYTVYSDKLELFIEFNSFVVGKTTNLKSHITQLGNEFKPIKEGSVSVQLIGEKDQPSYKSNSPASLGIFKLKLKPINSGKYDLVFNIKTTDF